MTRCAVAAALGVALATAGAWASGGLADPGLGAPVTVERTVTVKVPARYQGHTAREWRIRSRTGWQRAHTAERDGRARARTIRRLRDTARARWAPTVSYAYTLAAAVSGIPRWEIAKIGHCCESTDIPTNSNGDGVHIGLFALSWDPYGFSKTDPVASALSAAMTRVHDGSWRQWAASRPCSGLR